MVLVAGLALALGSAPAGAASWAPMGEPAPAPVAPEQAEEAAREAAHEEAPLARRAKELADAGRPLDAWNLLVEELPGLLGGLSRQASAAAPRTRAEAEVALLLLARLTRMLDAWPETAAALATIPGGGPPGSPLQGDLSPSLAFRLRHLHAEALRNVGRPDEARSLIDAQGAITAFQIIGPFDNERGGGHHIAYPPEERITYVAPDWPDGAGDFQVVPGKSRDVRWRPIAGQHHPLGRFLIDAMLRPSTQSVAYLATTLEVTAPRDLLLHFGTAGDFNLFLNGVNLAGRQVERPHNADLEQVVLPLATGVNVLLVKLGVEEGPWTFECRLTERDGTPVKNVPANHQHIGWEPPAPRAAPADSDPRREVTTRAILEGLDDVRGRRMLALYHLLAHPDDVVDRSAHAAATAALELEPDDVFTRYLLAQANEPEGASRHEMEVNRRLSALRAVLERDPDHVGALLDLAEFSMRESPQPDRADELTRAALAAAPGSWQALRLRARHLQGRGRAIEADALLRQAEAGAEADLSAAGLLARARRLGRTEGRSAELEALRRAFPRLTLPGPLADHYVRRLIDAEQWQAALDVVDQTLWSAPFDNAFARRALRLFESGPLIVPARRLSERVLDICPEHSGALLDRVRLRQRVGDVAGAVEDLEQVLALTPGDETSRRRLTLMTQAVRDEFETPWRRDGAALANAPLDPDLDTEAVELLDRTVVWRVYPDGTEHSYHHEVWRVLGSLGIKQLDTMVVPAPAGATVQVFNVRVIHPDGRIERAPAPRGRFEGARWYDLPTLRIGDVVDVEYRVDQSEPDEFGEYFGIRHVFYPDQVDSLAPTRRSELVVIAPESMPVHVAERNADALEKSVVTGDDGLTVHRWVARDLRRPMGQSGMPVRDEFAPLVDITTYRDWDAFARWWYAFIEKEFVTTPPMRAKVAELTAGLQTEEEMVAAIARFVGQEIRYNAWPFGTHGYEPFSASTIFERRFGDCKDKSILLRQLLAEVGVEAVPVLIKAEYRRPDEPLDAAMVGHFNHCIAWLPPTDARPGYYLDATADLNPVEYLRADDQGARVLRVSATGGELADIPFAPPDENRLQREYRIELADDGAGIVTLRDDSNGSFGVRLRARFGGEQGDIERALGAEFRGAFGALDVLDVSSSDLEDIAEPAWLDARWSAESLWAAQGDLRSLPVGFDDLGLAGLAAEAPAERTWDLVLDRPLAHETSVEWVLPPGWMPAELPDDVRVEAPGMLDYEQRIEATADGFVVHRRFVMHTRRVAVDGYANFREALRAVRQAEERRLLVGPGEGGSGGGGR